MSLPLALLIALAPPPGIAVEEIDEMLEFRYGWPHEAEAIAPLRAQLSGAMARERAAARRYAGIDRAEATADGRPFHAHWYEAGWRVDGSAPVLLSLSAEISTFTGGAHGNRAFEALLWDRVEGRRVDFAALVGRRALEALRPRFCAALDAMRAERRSEPVRPSPDDPFTVCPTLAEQEMAPADDDGDGRFESLRVMLPPYAAGPYAEGEYVVELGFEPGDLRDIEDGYRPAFEVAGERVRPLPDE